MTHVVSPKDSVEVYDPILLGERPSRSSKIVTPVFDVTKMCCACGRRHSGGRGRGTGDGGYSLVVCLLTGDHSKYLVPGRTYGTYENLSILIFLQTAFIWSYLLWSPVIIVLLTIDQSSPFERREGG